MRNLAECQAEVFRRSEKRIQTRRQRRKKMLAACVPLVLCAAVFGAMHLADRSSGIPSVESVPGGTNVQYSGAMGTDGYLELTAGTVAVSGNGVSRVYTDGADVQRIFDLLDRIVYTPAVPDKESTDTIVGNGNLSTDLKENHGETGYRILLKRHDGTGAEYRLVDSVLIDQTTKEKFSISGDTCSALKDALGISGD